LIEALDRGAVVLTTAGLPNIPSVVNTPAACLAQVVGILATQHPPAGLVLTGGDAAIAVSIVLQAEALHLHGELAPGVPWGTLTGGALPELPVVTKAGGFGDENTLLAAIRFF
jgi:D-threonate/D-erythronate kinase